MIRTYIFLYLVSCLLISSCNDEGIYYTLDRESIEYFAPAKNGSWWIFSDSLRNKRDSFYISDYKINRYFTGERPKGDSYQGIRYKLNSIDKINRAELNIGWMHENITGNYFDYKSTSGVDRNYFYNLPLIIRDKDSLDVESCITCGIEILDSLDSGPFEFKYVIKVWQSPDTFYFAQHIGLVRFYEKGNEYLLQNYLIIK